MGVRLSPRAPALYIKTKEKRVFLLAQYNPISTAVLVVDMQVGYCSPEGIRAKEGFITKPVAERLMYEFVPKLAAFLKEARKQGLLVIHTYIEQPSFPEDTKFIDACAPAPNDETWRRWDANKTIYDDEGFQNFLLFGGSHIKTFIIVGVYSHACVKRHALAAHECGYEAAVPPDLSYP